MSAPDTTPPTLTLIQQIQAGAVQPATLDAASRQQCVEVLTGEGYTQHAIAQILHCSDRTIRRDLAALRDRQALAPCPELVVELVGQMVTIAERQRTTLTRLARDPQAAVRERAQAAYLAWRVERECIERLQALGYLPTTPTTVVADVSIRGDATAADAFTALRDELRELAELAGQAGVDTPGAERERQALLSLVEHLGPPDAGATSAGGTPDAG